MTHFRIPENHITGTPARALTPLSAGSRGLAGALLDWWHSRTAPSSRQLRLLETLPLGPKRSVALLDLDGQRFLVGMGADGVHSLLQVAPTPATHEEHR